MNGCFNRAPFVESVAVQDGWYASGPRRKVPMPFRMSRDCEYTKSDLGQVDAKCVGCKHKQPGETQ